MPPKCQRRSPAKRRMARRRAPIPSSLWEEASLTLELAAKIARFRGQKVPVTVYSRDRIMPKVFREDIAPEAGSLGAKDVAEFYERQLVKCGVKFIREHRCSAVGRRRVWRVSHDGGAGHIVAENEASAASNLVQGEYFSTCRGIVVENNHSQETVVDRS